MRSLYVKRMIAGFVVALFFPVLLFAQTPNIGGNYALYQEGDMSGKVVGHMRIIHNGNTFSIGIAYRTGNPAMDWQGNGEITGYGGLYFWRFDDGKQGQTTFTIDGEGNLHGHVQGSGIDWNYKARRE